MCMKCFLTYENYQQFRKHLYYKHEDEHQICEKCHQKTWTGFVYHFCIEPKSCICEICEASFDRKIKLQEHIDSAHGKKVPLDSL